MRNTIRVFALILILGFAGEASAQVADPAPSPVLAYEGRLVESGALVTGARPFTFSILDSKGDVLWTSGAQTLTVTSGLYGVVLGATGMPALPATLTLKANLVLHVIADGVTLSPDVPLIPALQASTAWDVIGPFLGDVSGTQQTISVNKLQGTPLNLAVAPSSGEVLTFNGTSWIASAATGGAGSQGPAGPQGPAGSAGAAGATGLAGPAGVAGSQGAAGAAGTGVISGAVNPTAAVGVDGDFYINTAANTIFGPRVAGVWPTGISLIGPAGAAGAAGAAGSQGLQGLAGVTGATGATGAAGPAGASPFTLDGANAVFTTGSVGLGIDPPNTTAALDVTSTTKGLLAPRMTSAQRGSITTPANGLIVYDTTLKALLVYDSVGVAWNQLLNTASNGTVTNVTANAPLSVTNGASTPAITLGTVTVPFGGTGATTLTGYLLGNGTGTVTASATIPASAMSGVSTVSQGGTGAATAAGALTNLLPSQTGNGGDVLTTSGTTTSWVPAATGTVTSVTGTSPITVGGTAAAPVVALTLPLTVPQGGTGSTNLTGYLTGNGAFSPVTASTTINGATVTGNISGNAANVTGTVATANGGTGGSGGVGYLYGNGSSAVSYLTSIAGASVSGNISGSAGSLTGTVAIANGGTGATSLPSGSILYSTGTAVAAMATSNWNSSTGHLTIGEATDGGAPLYVATSASEFLTSVDDYGASGSSFVTNTFFVSIATGNDMVASGFIASSDARIKNVVDRSDTASDLETLKKLQITDFRYIDARAQGNQIKKGVIAQEVEKIYPNAVHEASDFIPSVYAMADDVSYNEATQELTMTVPKAHDFAVGDMVRIITDAGTVQKPVAEVIDENTFVPSGVEKPVTKAFVYGKKVSDFRAVDYDQLFSMNIGATQQLATENEALKARIAALELAVAALQKQK